MTHMITLMPGDGIGPEVIAQAVKVLDVLREQHGLDVKTQDALVGGAAYDAHGDPYPDVTKELARHCDAILFGAIGGPQYDTLPRDKRPESGLLAMRSDLGLYGNLRPAILFEQLAGASSLKPEIVAGLDILIVRELTGGIYFGQPRGIEARNGVQTGFNTLVYGEDEIRRIAKVAFEAASRRNGRLCSVDKANVLDVSQLWRDTVNAMAADYPDVELTHMYVDNAAMQLVREPKQFDVIVTGNLFGDILSDLASMLTGSIGMLPSASLGDGGHGMYEPVHGSAPDIAGQDKANPLATILSLAMLLRHSLNRGDLADKVEAAVSQVLSDGLRTGDIAAGCSSIGCQAMGDAVAAALR